MTNIYDTSILQYNGDGNAYMESLEIDSWNKFVDVAMESVGMSDNIEIKDFLYKYADSMVYEKAVDPNREISKLLREAKNEYKTSLKKARKAIKTGDKNTAHAEVNNAIAALTNRIADYRQNLILINSVPTGAVFFVFAQLLNYFIFIDIFIIKMFF